MKSKVMKLKYLAAACMAMGASSAFAAAVTCDATTPLNMVNTCTPDYTLYVGGSSALAGAITQVAPADLFDTSLPIVTVVDDGSPNGNLAGASGAPKAVSAWYGTAKSGLGNASGKKLFVVYNKQNGSAAGISQLLSPIKDTTIPEQDVVTIGPISKVSGVVAATQAASLTANGCTLDASSSTTVHCTTHARTQADVGVSDVAPIYLFALEGAKPKALSTLKNYELAIQGFGIGVNANLYNALQAQQLADGRLSSTVCSVGDLTAACQPSISSADYASLASQEGSIKSAAALLGNPSDSTLLKLERRDNLSGTQSSSNVFFLENPCLNSVDTKGKAIKGVVGGELHPLDTTPDATKLIVNLNATNSTVVSSLSSTTGYSIGVVGLNGAEPARTATSWKYVKIDGVSPNFNANGTNTHKNRDQFANGNYKFAVASYAATQIKPFSKTSVVTTAPEVVTALIAGLKDSTLHDLAGIGYIDGAADPSVLDGFNKQAHYIHTSGNSCSPLIKM